MRSVRAGDYLLGVGSGMTKEQPLVSQDLNERFWIESEKLTSLPIVRVTWKSGPTNPSWMIAYLSKQKNISADSQNPPLQRPNSRSHQSNQQKRKIKGVKQHRHSFIPPKHNKHSIHPVRDLRNARHRTPFRLDVVRVGVASEFGG